MPPVRKGCLAICTPNRKRLGFFYIKTPVCFSHESHILHEAKIYIGFCIPVGMDWYFLNCTARRFIRNIAWPRIKRYYYLTFSTNKFSTFIFLRTNGSPGFLKYTLAVTKNVPSCKLNSSL